MVNHLESGRRRSGSAASGRRRRDALDRLSAARQGKPLTIGIGVRGDRPANGTSSCCCYVENCPVIGRSAHSFLLKRSQSEHTRRLVAALRVACSEQALLSQRRETPVAERQQVQQVF